MKNMKTVKFNKLKAYKALEIILWVVFTIVIILALCGGVYLLTGNKNNPQLEKIAEIFLALSPIIAILNVPLLFLKIKGIIKTHRVTHKIESNLETTQKNKIIKAAKDLKLKEIDTLIITKKMDKATKKKIELKLIEKFLNDLGISTHDIFLIELFELIERKAQHEEIKNLIFRNSCIVVSETNIIKLKKLI